MPPSTAQTETDYTEVIDKCVAALRLGVKGETKQFATELISWSLNRRGQCTPMRASKNLPMPTLRKLCTSIL